MKRVLALLLAASLAANVYLAFLLLDAAVALDDAHSVANQLFERRELALQILRRDWIGRSVGEVEALAEELRKQGVITGVDGSLREVGDFLFVIEDGAVVDVQDLDSAVQIEP